jgi:hypothetical protein
MPTFKIPVDIFIDAEDEDAATSLAFEMMLIAKQVENTPEADFCGYSINNFAVVETGDLEHSLKQWKAMEKAEDYQQRWESMQDVLPDEIVFKKERLQ